MIFRSLSFIDLFVKVHIPQPTSWLHLMSSALLPSLTLFSLLEETELMLKPLKCFKELP